MYTKLKQYINSAILLMLLPFIAGCGVGGLTALGSLFGGIAGGGGGAVALASLPSSGATAAGIASIHQPEPASMLLMGGGMAALALFKCKGPKRS